MAKNALKDTSNPFFTPWMSGSWHGMVGPSGEAGSGAGYDHLLGTDAPSVSGLPASNQLPPDFWAKQGFTGTPYDTRQGESYAGLESINPELQAWADANGYTPGYSTGYGSTYGYGGVLKNGLLVPGSEFGNRTNDDRAFIAGMLGIGGAGALMAGGAGAGASGAEALGEAGGYGFTSAEGAGGLTELGSAGLSDGSFLGDISGQGGWDAMNVGADPSSGSLQTMGQAPMPQEFGALPQVNQGAVNGSNFMGSVGDFFSGNSSLDTYLRAGQLVGGLYAQNKATGAAQKGNDAQNALLSQMYTQNRADNQPLLDMRNSVLPQIQGLLKDPSTITQDPGYQFGLKQGTNQLNNRAAASGNYYSGAQMKAAQQFGQDYAGTKLDQSLNRLTNVAGLGQVGANNNQANNSNFGVTGGNALAQGGNIRGSGYLGAFNTANNAANGWMQDQLDRKYWGGGP